MISAAAPPDDFAHFDRAVLSLFRSGRDMMDLARLFGVTEAQAVRIVHRARDKERERKGLKFRYVKHDDRERYLAMGWIFENWLGLPHADYACLMRACVCMEARI